MRKLLLVAGLAALTPAASLATVPIGGYDFDDNAFADVLVASSGEFATSGGSLADVLTDIDPATYAFSRDPGAFVVLDFTDNLVVNGAGADLVLFELGVPDTWLVTINDVTRRYTAVDTGFEADGFALTAAPVDLADFGIVANETVNRIRLAFVEDLDQMTIASTGLAAAIYTEVPVPEPSTWALMIAGFGLVGIAIRRRKAIAA